MAFSNTTSRYVLAVRLLANNEHAIADFGCTSHFMGINAHCTNIQQCAPGMIVKLPNSMSMEETHTAILDIPNIPTEARQRHLFPDMGSKALLSIAQFVDYGYKSILTAKALYMVHETNPSMSFEGTRDSVTRMGTINLDDISKQTNVANNAAAAVMGANNVYDFTLKQDIFKCLHCAVGSPAPTTWCEAIDNNHYATWTGLSLRLVCKHLPKSIATIKVHMQQIRQNLRSAKPKEISIHDIPPTSSEMTMKSNMDNVQQNTVTIRCTGISGIFFQPNRKIPQQI